MNTVPSDSDRIASLESRVKALEDILKGALVLAKKNPVLGKFIDLTKISL